ncbi:hypothetical protein [Epilithonimonas hominis]|uniref:hypothetical protein n=1 Tax=Epilithonimonas hominis TaxID=420404 RepID=UPI001FEB656A|nr:hypothetical protein [Epilithonimonas hominis]
MQKTIYNKSELREFVNDSISGKGKKFGILPQLFSGSQPRNQKNLKIRFDKRGNSGGDLSFG